MAQQRITDQRAARSAREQGERLVSLFQTYTQFQEVMSPEQKGALVGEAFAVLGIENPGGTVAAPATESAE